MSWERRNKNDVSKNISSVDDFQIKNCVHMQIVFLSYTNVSKKKKCSVLWVIPIVSGS